MKINCKTSKYRIDQNEKVRLEKRETKGKPLYDSKEHYEQLLEESSHEMSALQNVMYAHDRYALLLIFQGMDAAGKDGAIKHVMSGIDPQGCQVFSFKQPSKEDMDHDFLWRAWKSLPERGRIGIFNRSYYEDVLVVRVYPEILKAQRIPEEFVNPKKIWKERYQDINNMEDYLHRNGTRIVKFYLNLSKDEQRERFLSRIDDPEKNWKLTRADIEVRQKWEECIDAYEHCLSATSTEVAPWYVVPADDKKNARLIISQVIIETLESLKMEYPKPSEGHREELQKARKLLE